MRVNEGHFDNVYLNDVKWAVAYHWPGPLHELALILLASGAPVGGAVASLIAGPSVNLPSLRTLMRSTNWKVAAVLGVSIWTLAVGAGIFVSFF